MVEIAIEDFSKKLLWYRAVIGDSKEISCVTPVRDNPPPPVIAGLGLSSKFRGLANGFIALYRLPRPIDTSNPQNDESDQLLFVDGRVFEIQSAEIQTTFKAGWFLREFMILQAGVEVFRLKYFPPFSWSSFDGERWRYYDIFWMAHVTNRNIDPN